MMDERCGNQSCCGCGIGNIFGGNTCLWIIIILVVLFCCCGNNNYGC